MSRRGGQSADVDTDNFGNDMLDQSESLDSDEIRNDDGDEVVDPPDQWIDAEEHESLDDKLSAETPDEADVPDVSDPETTASDAHDARAGGALNVVSDDDLDHIDPDRHGRDRGQIDGTPEDGESFFNIER
ncbi:hypothetical protein A5791_19505 [Mycobacterium sp. 852002-51163_SCH5372311]|uniref:hypothetical protein n=1 Tax=Mycobacterium sp. 852002-51163_SCH5372311 TaxID=1834097 RepID=UPI0007FE7716|nr:hypothetical protein [Mycobacterium sp. 852002-51163_SCH5372311]OBF87266.1 hypothetical protein A5791_19505 [Mycobacterium sp. 852002-51163_SCH5372311]